MSNENTNTTLEEVSYVPFTNAGVTPKAGFQLMAYENSMADQAALNNANWHKADEYLVLESLTAEQQLEVLNYATRIAILEHSLPYRAAWIDSDGTLNLVLQDSTWVPSTD